MLRETLAVRAFAFAKIPLLSFVRPRVVEIGDARVVVRVPLGRRTRNHVGSMYFGALWAGADLAAGLAAMNETRRVKAGGGPDVSLVFKDARGDFVKKARGDVHFTSEDVPAVREAVARAASDGKADIPVHVRATVPSHGDEEVGRFVLTLALRRR